MTSVLTERITKAKQEGRLALVPFLPGGYPDRETFWKELKSLDDSGADVIEIGVPFSDPVADGPVVEAASCKCVDEGISLAWILDELKKRKGQFKAGLVLMGYMNPFYVYGFDKLAKDAAEAGVGGFIVPDLPYEESGPMREALEKENLSLIPLVGLNTNRERMSLYAAKATGFAYFVSVLGTTGEREALPQAIKTQLGQAKELFPVPVVIGFGLKRPEQLEELKDLADGAVFGSALITHINEGKSAAEFMSYWK